MINVIASIADAQKLASTGRVVARSEPISSFPRLVGLVSEAEGTVHFELTFEPDGMGRPSVQVRIEARVPLLCQRSLETFLYPISSVSHLGFITDEAEEASLLPGYDPLLLGTELVEFLDIVEDELILAIPQVPVNPLSAKPAQGAWEAKAPEDKNPFADLSALLKGANSKPH